MKLSVKLLVPLSLFIIGTATFFLVETKNSTNQLEHQPSAIPEPTAQPQNIETQFDSPSANEKALNALKVKAEKAYKQTFTNGDISRRKQMSLEDNWCIAREDLRPSDERVYVDDVKDWLLSRGHISKKNPISFQGTNSEYLEPYLEMNEAALQQLASKDDFLALYTLLAHPPAEQKNKTDYANRLLILGDTNKGLSHFLSMHLLQAELLSIETGNITPEVTEHILKALAYAEYGLMRKDFTAMGRFLISAAHPTNTFDIKSIVKSLDKKAIHDQTLEILNRVNKARSDMNLPALQKEAAQIQYPGS